MWGGAERGPRFRELPIDFWGPNLYRVATILGYLDPLGLEFIFRQATSEVVQV